MPYPELLQDVALLRLYILSMSKEFWHNYALWLSTVKTQNWS
jgi:hypothetical protein